MTVFGYRLPMMSSLIVWCLIWEIVGRLELVLLFPPFTGVLVALVDLVQTQKFWDATWTTISTFCIGMVLAIVCGVALGVLMGRVKAAENLLGMWGQRVRQRRCPHWCCVLFGMGAKTIMSACSCSRSGSSRSTPRRVSSTSRRR
jgi:NitT/TauT family transport system permease protein